MSWAGYGETSKTCETGETGETGRRFHHPRQPRSKTRSESGGPSAVGRHNIVRGWQPQLHRKRRIRVDPCAAVVEPRGAIREGGHSCLLVSLRGLPGLVRVFRAFRGRPCGASRKSLRRYDQRHRPGSPDPSYRCTAFIRVDPCASVVAPRGAIRERGHSCLLVSLRGLPGLVRVFRAFRGRPCGASRKSLRRYPQRHRPGSPDPSYRCTAFIRGIGRGHRTPATDAPRLSVSIRVHPWLHPAERVGSTFIRVPWCPFVVGRPRPCFPCLPWATPRFRGILPFVVPSTGNQPRLLIRAASRVPEQGGGP